MLIKLLSIENTKIFRRLVIWVELLLFASMAGGAYLLIGLNNPASPVVLFPQSLNHSRILDLTTGYSLGGIFFIVLVAASTAPEYAWGTFNLLLSRSAPRPHVLAAKFISLLLPAVLIALLPQIGGTLISVFFTLSHTGSLSTLSLVDWKTVGESVLLAAFTLLPYGALAFFLAMVTRSAIFSIGVAGAYGLIGENILIRVLGFLGKNYLQIAYYLPTGLTHGLMTLVEPSAEPGLFSPAVSAAGILVYVAIFLGLATWIFQRQDLSSGS